MMRLSWRVLSIFSFFFIAFLSVPDVLLFPFAALAVGAAYDDTRLLGWRARTEATPLI